MSKKEKKLSNSNDAAKLKADKHKRKQKNLMAGTIVVLALTIVSFVFVPALAGSAGASGSLVFGKYGNTPIKFEQGNYFSQQVESINSMYRDNLGSNGNMDFLRQLIWRSAFNQTIVRTAMLDDVESADAEVSSRKIDRAIVTTGIFNENGTFNEEAYMNTPGTRMKEIRDSLEEDLKVQTYYMDTLNNIQRSDKQIDFLLSMGSTEKNFSYASLPYSAYPVSKVTEYGKDNSDIFSRRDLNRITVYSSEKEALDILNKLDNGSSFDELARNMSKDSYSENGGSMGETHYYNLLTFLDKEQADEVFALATDSYTGVISTDNAYFIFQAAGSVIDADTADNEVIASIRTYMEREEVGMIEDYLVEQAQALSVKAQSSDLLTAAADMGLETGETGFIAPVYGNIPFIVNSPGNKTNDSLLSSAAFSDDFFQSAFSLKTPGEVSEPVILDRRVIVFSLLDEQEGFQYPEEYKPYIESQLTSELNQYKESQIQSVYLNSDKLKDNFDETFSRIFKES